MSSPDGVFRAGGEDYEEPSPSGELIASIEAELGFRLPGAYIELARQRNGGLLARSCFPTNEPTGWAEDHIAVTGLYAIGRTSACSLCGELGSTFMRDSWGYPAWGVGIADTPTAGHEQVMLDYRECGPDGEPAVVYVDQEADYRVTVLAPDFASFIEGLVDEAEFEDPEADRAAALDTVEHGSLSPLVLRALEADPALAGVDVTIRRLGRAIVDDKGYFAVHADARSRLLLDAMFLLHSRIAAPRSLEEFLHGVGPTGYDHPSLRLMLFASMTDDPYGFCTRGYAPGFVESWWQDRIEQGHLHQASDTWALTPCAERDVLKALTDLA